MPRTGTKYLAVPTHEQNSSVSLSAVIRDILGIAKTRKELKKLLNEKKITVNRKAVRDTNYPLGLYDVLGLPSLKKYYRVMLKNKFELQEIPENDSKTKIYKVINKIQLPAKKIQLNLNHGRNIISNEKINVGDFAMVNFETNKIEKIISLKKDADVLVIAGKHIGKTGKVKEVLKEGEDNVAVIKTKDGEIKAHVKNIFAKE